MDPGLGRSGVALVDGHPGSLSLVFADCLETSDEASDGQRLLDLGRSLAALARRLRPEVAAVERLFFSTNRQTAMRVAEARGVILCTLVGAGIPVAEYTPTQVKESVAGYGAASKPQVTRMCAALLGVDRIGGTDDTADACAVAICHHHREALLTRSGSRRGAAVTPGLEAAVAAARRRTLLSGPAVGAGPR
ncbi:MAG TPA: crossover junction endodeoxyribonuclease RuvC [Candidatus Binatia bacterium]|nr:crossover junction endodeoxyribonuclease RuvC [Candidatus Binatia bacterium]